jgi:GT2 family glycosyltransferase
MDLSIVIPITDIRGEKNKTQLTNLLESLRGAEANIICCFDSCNPIFIEYFMNSFPEILPLINRKNRLHFARNVNRGLRYAHKILGTSVLLVNQDCVLPRWEVLKDWHGEGIVCGETVNEPDASKLNESNTLASKVKTEIKTKFPFSCVFLSSYTLTKVGYLDGSFARGSAEDDSYIMKAHLAGVPCEVINIKYYHEGDYIDSSDPNWVSASGSYNQTTLTFNLMQLQTMWQIPNSIQHQDMLEWVINNHTWNEGMKVE